MVTHEELVQGIVSKFPGRLGLIRQEKGNFNSSQHVYFHNPGLVTRGEMFDHLSSIFVGWNISPPEKQMWIFSEPAESQWKGVIVFVIFCNESADVIRLHINIDSPV